MRHPLSTYRVQLNSEFSFKDLERTVDYLDWLGVSFIYASPITQAVPGSRHGYDATDFSKINPEIGTLRELKYLSSKLKERGMGWLQDFAPNHMAYSHLNRFVRDIMEKGEKSKYSSYFDIQWVRKGDPHPGKICAPFLGKEYVEALEAGELSVDKKFFLKYFDKAFPLSPESVLKIREELKYTGEDYISSDEDLLRQIRIINSDRKLLDRLIKEQNYSLEYWKNARKEINYRRFFTINDLISLKAEKEWVYQETHRLIIDLISDGTIDGLRIDHIDGLMDPGGYLIRLEESGKFYRVVEKILMQGEEIPHVWDCNGTTGYDFLGELNSLFTLRDSEEEFRRNYVRISGNRDPYQSQLASLKRTIIQEDFSGNLENIVQIVKKTMESNDSSYAPDERDIRQFITTLATSLAMYRTYVLWGPVPNSDELSRLEGAVSEIGSRHPDLVEFCKHYSSQLKGEKNLEGLAGVVQQLTGPVMAKALEDTLFFRFVRLISLNEVGSSPDRFGSSVEAFHTFIKERGVKWKSTMNCTSTHDTKLGEDARARISVLSEMPEKWFGIFRDWSLGNSVYKRKTGKSEAPDRNDEYLIYQVMLASMRFEDKFSKDFTHRVSKHVMKAIREAGVHTSWAEPDHSYEEAVASFIEGITDIYSSKEFTTAFENFWNEISALGALTSLSQLAIKMTVPGVPDIYQGSELWNLSLADPDNRSPLDPDLLMKKMDELERMRESRYYADNLVRTYRNGLIKLHFTERLLNLRRQHFNLFMNGEYVPLEFIGGQKARVVAFARKTGDEISITIAPRFFSKLTQKGKTAFKESVWADTDVMLKWNLDKVENALTGEEISLKGKTAIGISKLLGSMPASVLVGKIPGGEIGQ